MKIIQILVADDSEPVRRSLRALLGLHPRKWALCGEASNGAEIFSLVAASFPHVVLLDLNIPQVPGLEVAETLKREYPEVTVVLMSEQDPKVLTELTAATGFLSIAKVKFGTALVPLLETIALTIVGRRTENPPSQLPV